MSLVISSLFITLIRTTLLFIRPSLPLQTFALLTITVTTGTLLASNISILLGIYTILIYARGLLVLLAYFVALTPNQTLNSPSRLTSLLSFTLITAIIIQSKARPRKSHIANTEEGAISIITILTPSSGILFIIIALTLVLTIIAVVKVSRLRSGPIRS